MNCVQVGSRARDRGDLGYVCCRGCGIANRGDREATRRADSSIGLNGRGHFDKGTEAVSDGLTFRLRRHGIVTELSTVEDKSCGCASPKPSSNYGRNRGCRRRSLPGETKLPWPPPE